MQNRWMGALALGFALLVGFGGQVSAQVITENRSGASASSSAAGQSVSFAGGGPYFNFTFNFYRSNSAGGAAFANGDLLLLSQAYAGTTTNLSSSTPGYLASSTASNNLWLFNLPSGLQASTQYFFYMKSDPGVGLGISSANTYANGDRYSATTGGASTYAVGASDMNFTLAEAAAPVAAPPVGGGPIAWSIAALGLGGFGVWSQLRRRRDGALDAV